MINYSKFKASLIYTMSSKSARTTYQDHISKKRNQFHEQMEYLCLLGTKDTKTRSKNHMKRTDQLTLRDKKLCEDTKGIHENDTLL